ncbi:MAG: UvrD-helicase domain-containing protein [Firmicutes bacterium]|nr:UvrD-helicase domain-containing protein [Bacillota bacterium]
MTDFDNLNPMQQEAVNQTEGPVLILAGAGSGKTKTITVRIASLLADGVKPYKILALTFTNKAAGEMRDRINALVGDAAKDVWISTFHSTCVRILRRDINKIGMDRSFSIYDASDAERLMKDVFKELKISATDRTFTVKGAIAEINAAKEELISPAEYDTHTDNDPRKKKYSAVYRRYQDRLKSSNALDFEDLIYKTIQLFTEAPEVLEYYQNRFSYIMVDEYQDTNTSQYELVRLLSDKHKNICVVGDDDQSIYGWRGANIRNILEFEKDFPGAKVIKLEENYRSTKTILDAANSVIKNNVKRKNKRLWTQNEKGGIIHLHTAENDIGEAKFIIKKIRERQVFGRKLRDFAILYRTNAQSRVIEEQFVKEGIPYRIFGGIRFYERAEIKTLLAYLKLIVNPGDDISFKRIVNEPKRGIGNVSVDKLQAFAYENDMSLYLALLCLEDVPDLKSAGKKFADFLELMESFKEDAERMGVDELMETVVKRSGLEAHYLAEGEEGEYRLENIAELVSKAVDFAKDDPGATLADFLEEVTLVSDIDSYSQDEDTVSLMTLHSAKGLEFPDVFIVGMEEGVFPSYRAIMYGTQKEMEEERRLCYVGITRAKEELFLTNAKQRMTNGMTHYNAPSRFLEEIPEELLKVTKFSYLDKDRDKPEKRSEKRQDFRVYIPPVRKMPAPKGQLNYAEGDKVRSPKYGIGTVVSIVNGGADFEVTIDFPKYGQKKFMASLAKLIKV